MLLFASFHDSLLQIAQSIKRCLFSATHFSALRFFFQTIVVLGILTVQTFRDEMILFSTNFHFIMILFSSASGGKGSDLEMALAGEQCAGFCSINGLHCCSCNSLRRGEEGASYAGPLICLPLLLSSCLDRWKSYSSGRSFPA